jgi:hypothetical protein
MKYINKTDSQVNIKKAHNLGGFSNLGIWIIIYNIILL